MSMIICKYGCLSDTDEHPDFGYDEKTSEYTCSFCLENEADEMRMRQYDQRQSDMFNDPSLNWSGLR